jgi:preprotein translocase subunit SecF
MMFLAICRAKHRVSTAHAKLKAQSGKYNILFYFILRFIYLFYVYEYTVAVQIVVSLHVVGN